MELIFTARLSFFLESRLFLKNMFKVYFQFRKVL